MCIIIEITHYGIQTNRINAIFSILSFKVHCYILTMIIETKMKMNFQLFILFY